MLKASSILIIKTSSLGDVVCALPTLTQLRQLYPQARIGWVIDHRFADLLEGHPWIDELVVFRRHKVRLGRGMPQAAAEMSRELARTSQQLRQGEWDVALDLQSILKSLRLLRGSGARVRIAEFAGLRHAPVPVYANKLVFARRAHEVQRCLEVAAPLGTDPERVEFFLPPVPEAAAWAEEQVKALPAPRVVVSPGSARAEKRWAPKNFAQALRMAREGGADFSVVLVGAPGDAEAARTIEAALGEDCLNLTGQTSLKQLVAVISQADVFLSGDTGPMHIAAAVGKKVVALFGPTDPRKNGPWGAGHTVIKAADGRVASLQPQQVATALAEALDEIS
ncbi:MAG: glycosyltransferase family 9 protein [Armatimonadetes bacterium]|nr:glycosyltransferase family 9 protein [Armatimonadota bacterium]